MQPQGKDARTHPSRRNIIALTINTNVASLNAQRKLNSSATALSKSMTRLSSGLRINSAKDDAAGSAISEKMHAQIRGLNQAVRNANDGISLAQTAEGALQETTNIMQRMRELAVQGGNDTLTSSDRDAIGAELLQLGKEISRIATTTSFNNKNLLDGTFSGVLQVGANGSQVISIKVSGSMTASALGLNSLVITSNAQAGSVIGLIDSALNTVATARSELGAVQNRLESTISNLSNISENISSARSRILDADIAQETSIMTKNNILQQAGVSILAQANQAPNLALSLLR